MPTAANQEATGYLPTLDGWRAVAILLVLIAHDRVHRLGWFSTGWMKVMGGERGVQLFFALSGILICTRLLQEEQVRGAISLKGFYIRRVCRIQPAALLYLAVITALTLERVLAWLPGDIFASLLLVRNYLPLHDSNDSWYTAHYWSLSVEEHFYLFLPSFLVLVKRFRATVLGLLVIALACWRVVVDEHRSLQFSPVYEFRTDTAVGPILFAAMIAILLMRPDVRGWCARRLHPWVGLLFAAVLWTRVARHHGRFDDAILMVTYPFLIVSTMLHPGSLLGRLLETAPMRFLGRISYSLYLWQMLFFVYARPLQPPHSSVLVLLQAAPLRYAALLLAALGSYYWVERPMMRLGHRLAKPATVGREDLEPATR